jgi:flavin-dependent dehydrogenase
METQFDVVIIGGGPSGASAATILAEYGHRVLIIEREKFPRYHVGESLIPFTSLPLQRLGLREKMQGTAFVRKHSVQFIGTNGKGSQPFYFADRYPDDVAQTWQILRSEFDEMLLNHAREKGAMVHEETKVLKLLRDGDRITGVLARHADGTEVEYTAPITLDCTGKESFASSQLKWRIPDPMLNKVAVWTYYKGAKRDEGIDEGATTVAYIPEKGWFWYIPQHNDMVSVGVVAEGKYLTRDGVRDLKQIFDREVENNVWIKEYLSHGRQVGAYRITNEYTFHSRHCACEGLLLVGDAYCFLDPVFSSGLMLALKSGVMAGDAVHKCITENDFSPVQFEEYGQVLREGIENMRKLVYAFYDKNFSFARITRKYPELAGQVTDCLSGDVNKDYTDLFNAISEFASLPDDLPVGGPLVSHDSSAAVTA